MTPPAPAPLAAPLRRRLLGLAGLLPLAAFAQPISASDSTPADAPRPTRNPDEPIGPTIADRPSEHYTFERLAFDSADGQRHYRVYLGIPRQPAPAGGYPALYMLDGNAAMLELEDGDLAALAAGDPPVLVGIGYDVETRHDVLARAFDYTPPVFREGVPEPTVTERGRPGGGADRFLELLEHRVRPAVEQRASLDPNRQTLWGHSYGGLFALYALMTRPALFQRYVAGDPSVAWYDSALLDHAARFNAGQAPGVSVQVMVGGSQRPGTPGVDTPQSVPATGAVLANGNVNGQRTPVIPPGRQSTYDLVNRLAGEGMDITFESFPEQSHGQLFNTSLQPALQASMRP